jgi:hypothetical protein
VSEVVSGILLKKNRDDYFLRYAVRHARFEKEALLIPHNWFFDRQNLVLSERIDK